MAQLRPLSEHENVRFGKDSYDVRNWKVRTRADDQEIGKVHDALLDENARTRYLDIDVMGGRHVLIPSGDVRVDPTDEVVHIPGMDRDRMNNVPDYDQRPESVTPEYSRSLSEAYESAYDDDDDYYDRSDYTTTRRSETEERSPSGTLGRLDELDDVDVASDEPDPRGWDVLDADGERVGEVDHIIGDTGAMTARYLTVELDDDDGRGGQVLLPVGHVDLDTDEEHVVASALRRERIEALPRYEGGTIDRDYETRLRQQFDESYTGESLFEHPRYRSDELDTEVARVQRSEEELKVGTRDREAGEVEVKKRVEKETVRKPVVTHHEEVEIERRSVSGRTSESEIGEDEVRIPISEEEIVTEKKPRVKEEIVVKKKDVEETQIVEDEIRKERVDVDRRDDHESRR